MRKVGFLGPGGTFSQEAMFSYIKDKEYKTVDFKRIPDILLGVENGFVDEGVVPIENSLEGAVGVTLDMMALDVSLKIKSEIVIEINQNLLVRKGTEMGRIRKVLSHPQSIGQCGKFIGTNLSHSEVVLVDSTASAAMEVARGDMDLAAIGSSVAASIYGLDILAGNIQDEKNNLTRFIVIGKEEAARTGFDKTSIVFSTEDRPGSLYRILDIFNLWDINMTRIESRPAKNALGKYIFFVDVQGHIDDNDIRDAIRMIKRKTSFFKLLGSYPGWKG